MIHHGLTSSFFLLPSSFFLGFPLPLATSSFFLHNTSSFFLCLLCLLPCLLCPQERLAKHGAAGAEDFNNLCRHGSISLALTHARYGNNTGEGHTGPGKAAMPGMPGMPGGRKRAGTLHAVKHSEAAAAQGETAAAYGGLQVNRLWSVAHFNFSHHC